MSCRLRPIFEILFTFGMLLLQCATASAMCGAGEIAYHSGKDGWYYGSSMFPSKRFSKRIEGADIASFRVLPGAGSDIVYNPCKRDSGYATDRFHVYREAAILPHADPATFSFLDRGYSRDATHVYYLERLLVGTDAVTFREVGSGFFKDSVHVYLSGYAINGADPGTFFLVGKDEYPGYGLAHDANHVFFGASVVVDAGPKDIKSLGRQYWSSNGIIFFADQRLSSVDASSFRVASEDEPAFSAEDEDRYFLGIRTVNKAECRSVGSIVLACRGYILSAGRKYTGVDSASLRYLGRFPETRCDVIGNSLIYQDSRAIYEFYGDGIIMKFIAFDPDKQYSRLDATL